MEKTFTISLWPFKTAEYIWKTTVLQYFTIYLLCLHRRDVEIMPIVSLRKCLPNGLWTLTIRRVGSMTGRVLHHVQGMVMTA